MVATYVYIISSVKLLCDDTFSLFVCYLIESCRHSATYDNGTSKGNGGNIISEGICDKICIIVCVAIPHVVLLLVVVATLAYRRKMIYRTQKKRKGKSCHYAEVS